MSLLYISGNLREFRDLVSFEVPVKYSSVIIKAFGISFICETSSDILCEVGSERLARSLEFAGKAEILLLTIPQIKDLLNTAGKLL